MFAHHFVALRYELLITILLIITLPSSGQDKSHEFDFWIGEWDVNLRVKQEDNSWKDQHQAVAKIYPILGGKAILELWEEQGAEEGIIGYSLRYYNNDLGKWVLWLNWPGQNRSGTSQLTGEFKHGRGEFFAERKVNDTLTRISRYTFSDISPNSLRWDDAFSTDGGKSWTNNWIMEFTRRKDRPASLNPGKENHTNKNENRCNTDEFDTIKNLTSLKSLHMKDGNISLYGILEGCAVIGLIENEGNEELSILTFNTYAQIYEQLVFKSDSGNAGIYYGKMPGDTIVLRTRSESMNKLRKWVIHESEVSIIEYKEDESDDPVVDLKYKK